MASLLATKVCKYIYDFRQAEGGDVARMKAGWAPRLVWINLRPEPPHANPARLRNLNQTPDAESTPLQPLLHYEIPYTKITGWRMGCRLSDCACKNLLSLTVPDNIPECSNINKHCHSPTCQSWPQPIGKVRCTGETVYPRDSAGQGSRVGFWGVLRCCRSVGTRLRSNHYIANCVIPCGTAP